MKSAILFYDEPVALGDLDEASLQEMYADYDNLGPSVGGELRREFIHPRCARSLAHSLRTVSCGIFAGYPGSERPFSEPAATAPWR